MALVAAYRFSVCPVVFCFDSFFSKQTFHLNSFNPGQSVTSGINSVGAWDFNKSGVTAKGDSIVVAVLDFGFDSAHSDLDYFVNHNEIPHDGIDNDDIKAVEHLLGDKVDLAAEEAEEESETNVRKGQRSINASRSPLCNDVSDEDEAAAEALSTLQSGILLQQLPGSAASVPEDPTLVVVEKEGLPVLIGDDGAFTMLDRPLGVEELQRWASVVQLAARKKRRKQRNSNTPSNKENNSKRSYSCPPRVAKFRRLH
jgi:hypothetical protein